MVHYRALARHVGKTFMKTPLNQHWKTWGKTTYKLAQNQMKRKRANYDAYQTKNHYTTKRKISNEKNVRSTTIQHGDMNTKTFTLKNTKAKKAFKSLGTWQFLDQSTILLYNNEGRQGVAELKPIISAAQLLGAASTKGSTLWSQTPYDMNPFRTPPGNQSSVFTLGQPVVSNDDCHLKTVDIMTMITNQSGIATEVDIYFLTPKTTVNNGPVQVWNDSMVDKALGQGGALQPSNINTNAVAGAPTNTYYGQSPFSEKKFNQIYKTVHKSTFTLQAGGTQKYLYKHHVNRSFNKTMVAELSTFMANVSIIPMVVFRPGPVIINDTIPSVAKDVTIGIVQLGILQTLKYTWCAQAAARLELDRVFPAFVGHVTGVENIGLDTDVPGVNYQV